jgi:hypothetical protein
MARIPLKIDSKSTKQREVTVIVYVDGKEFTQLTQNVDEWAIPYVAAAACTQVDDPDYEAASDDAANEGR